MLPGYPASGPVCAQALHAKKLWKADALDNAAGDDTDDGIWSVRPWTGYGLTPLYLAYMRTWPCVPLLGTLVAGCTPLGPYHPFLHLWCFPGLQVIIRITTFATDMQKEFLHN